MAIRKIKRYLTEALKRPRKMSFRKLSRAVIGKAKVDEEVLDKLEEALVSSDVGVTTTLRIIERIEARVARDKYLNTSELNTILREEIVSLLESNISGPATDFGSSLPTSPYVILVVGVNGSGKTTTIAKIAYQYKMAGKEGAPWSC